MNVEQRIDFFLELLSCASKLCYWQFNEEMNCLRGPDGQQEMLERIMLHDEKKRQRIAAYGKSEKPPLISSSALGMEWVSVFEKEEGELKRIHVIGPFFSSDISEKTIETAMNQKEMTMAYRRQATELLKNLPVIPVMQILPYILMLHYCVTGMKITAAEVSHEAREGRDLVPLEKVDPKNRHAGIYAAEQQMFKMIEEGNLNYHEALNTAMLRATYGSQILESDPVRKSEVVASTFIQLSVRAAIRGGLPPATAYTVGDYYEAAVLSSKNIADIASILNTMYEDFIHRVRKCRADPRISKPIQACRDYIDMHITESISLSALAEVVGYTDYYLTRKFKKEMGVSIWDYINQLKVERAKVLLSDGSLTIQEISDMLSYCSRSYFSEIFQQHTGTSPSGYRKDTLKM